MRNVFSFGRGAAALIVPVLTASAVAVAGGGGSSVTPPPPRYRIVSLDARAGIGGFALDRNDRGQVVGLWGGRGGGNSGAGGGDRSFFWQSGRPARDLGVLPGMKSCQAFAINNGAQVVGAVSTRTADRAFHWDAARGMRALPLPGAVRGGNSGANDINDKGQIAGWASFPIGGLGASGVVQHAFVWYKGALRDLGTLPGGARSGAAAINNLGHVVGVSDTRFGRSRAFLWRGGVMQDLGTLPGYNDSRAVAINDRGQVVGVARNDRGDERAFLWHDGRLRDLGTLPGYARSTVFAINNRGEIIGQVSGPGGASRPTLWSRGRIYDLNRRIPAHVGWTLNTVTTVNDRGEIMGRGFFRGRPYDFVLRPG